MTPELEKEYLEFVDMLGVQRSKATGDTDPHTDQMSFILLHMVSGMCTEAGEFTELIREHTHYGNSLHTTKMKDELGDLFFYVCGAIVDSNMSIDEVLDSVQTQFPFLGVFLRQGGHRPQFGVPCYEIRGGGVSSRMFDATMGLVINAAQLLDLLKKHMAYKRVLDMAKVRGSLGMILAHLADACIELGTDFDEIIAMNMAKLRKRYPNGYTHQQANNRDRKAEDEAQKKVTNVDGESVVKGSEKDDRYGPNAFTK